MSKQRDILTKVVNRILQHVSDCAVYLSGSVRFGYERPESDVDIIVVVPDVIAACFPGGKVKSQTHQAKVVDGTLDGIRLDIVFITAAFLERELVRKPWHGYYFMQLEILHDPEGMIQSYQSQIAPWFDDRPDIVKVWKEWMAQRRARAVSSAKQQGELVREFPDIFALWEHLDQVVEEQTSAEPTGGGDVA